MNFYRWGKKSKEKFRNKRSTSSDGRSFHSKLERAVYEELRLRQSAGEFSEIKCQAQVSLTEAGIIYKPDFEVVDAGTGERYWIEAKGFETPEWRIKRRLWMHYGPGKLEIYKGSAQRFFLDETITPKLGGADANVEQPLKKKATRKTKKGVTNGEEKNHEEKKENVLSKS